MAPPFALDPKIEADTVPLASLALSDLRLMDDARYPWLLLVPARKTGAEEITDLTVDDARNADGRDRPLVAGALKTLTACDKLNVAALGNIVRQLHIHVIARFAADPDLAGTGLGRRQGDCLSGSGSG